jgi:5-methylcytosine-specific restriction endonuclease McrA
MGRRNLAHLRRDPGSTYDGVTDTEIYRRDNWTCRMPRCLCPVDEGGRAIDPELRGHAVSWAPSVDHVIPLAQGGRDDAANKRAAHQLCNADAAVALSRRLNQAQASSLRPPPRERRPAPPREPLPPAEFDLTVAARIPAAVAEALLTLAGGG